MPTCFVCKKTHMDLRSLWTHLQIIHRLHANSTFECGETNCLRMFGNIQSYRRHWRLVHNSREHSVCGRLDLDDTPLGLFNVNMSTESTSHDCSDHSEVYSSDSNICPDASRNEFERLIQQNALQMIAKLHTSGNIPRNYIQLVVESAQSFLSNSLKAVRGKVQESLAEIGNLNTFDKSNTVLEMIDKLETAFAGCSTEHQRLQYLKTSGDYVPADDFIIGHRLTSQISKETGHVEMVPVAVTGKHIPLRAVLKRVFEMPNVYERVKRYKIDLENESEVLSNFIQGDLWKQKILNCCEGKEVFPLFLYYDDFETGNALGSHAGAQKIGGVYVSVPCFPPEYQSVLSSIYVTSLFRANDRKEFGNKAVFKRIIDELQFLQEKGIEIELSEHRKRRIFFKLGLVIGDNLGLNSMLGFVENFNSRFSCRLCKMNKADRVRSGTQDDELLRNPATYAADLAIDNLTLTGIKEECVFNSLSGFHVTHNLVVDIMHDLLEGVCAFDMLEIIKYFTEVACLFTIDDLNNRISSYDYGPLESNRPPRISKDHIKNNKIRMSASEMLTFVCHFGIMVGDLVPENNPVWEFYLILRQIISLVTAKQIQVECCSILQSLIKEHNNLYTSLFEKPLKPKAHHLIHYPTVMKACGPLIHLWCMRFESKHKELKLTANVTACTKNTCSTLTTRHQMKLAFQFVSKTGFSHFLDMGPGDLVHVEDLSVNIEPDSIISAMNYIHVVRWVISMGAKYKPGMAICTGDIEGIPSFGTIKYIIINEGKISFLFETLEVIQFDSHLYAYQVGPAKSQYCNIIECEDLLYPSPLHIIAEHGLNYLSLRSWL